VVPDLVRLHRGFRECIGEDKLGLKRGRDGDQSFITVLPFTSGEENNKINEDGKARTRLNNVQD